MLKSITALDIDYGTIRLLKLENNRRVISITHCENIILDFHDTSKDVWQYDGLVQTLVTLRDEGLFAGSEIVVNLATPRVITRRLSFPFSDRGKIEEALPFRIEEFLSDPVENYHLVWQLIGPKDQGVELLCWAVFKHDVQQCIDVFLQAGLEPRVIYPEAAGCASIASSAAKQFRFIAYVRYGWTVISLVQSDEDKLIKVLNQRVLNFGWLHIAKHAAQSLNCSVPEIDQAVRKNSLDESAFTYLRQGFNTLSRKVSQTVNSLARQAGIEDDLPVEFNIPHGEIVPIEGLLDTDNLDVILSQPTIPADWQLGEGVRMRSESYLALNMAWRAMNHHLNKSLNVRRGVFRYQKDFAALKGKFIGTGILLLLLCILGFASLQSRVSMLERQKDEVQHQIQQIFAQYFPHTPAMGKEVVLVKRKIAELKSSILSTAESTRNAYSPLRVLKDVSELVPAGVTINVQEMSIHQKRIAMKGEIDSFKSVDLLRTKLQELPYISKVTTGKTTKSLDKDVLIFQMTAEVQEEK